MTQPIPTDQETFEAAVVSHLQADQDIEALLDGRYYHFVLEKGVPVPALVLSADTAQLANHGNRPSGYHEGSLAVCVYAAADSIPVLNKLGNLIQRRLHAHVGAVGEGWYMMLCRLNERSYRYDYEEKQTRLDMEFLVRIRPR